MNLTRYFLATAVLSLAGCAGAPVQNATALAISGEQVQDYWTPVTDTITRPVPRLRSGAMHTPAEKVTVTYLIDSTGKVHDARVVSFEPEGTSARWAVAAVTAFSYQPSAANSARTPVQVTHELKMLPTPPES